MKNGRFVKKEEYDRIISESNKKPKLKKEKLIYILLYPINLIFLDNIYI